MPVAINKLRSHTKKCLFKTEDENKTPPARAMHVPAANVDETDSEYIITIAAPGFDKEMIDIKIEAETLLVSASKKLQTTDWVHDRCEYDYSKWKRVFSLPKDADALMARANYKSGELIIRIPKGNNNFTSFPHPIYVY